ncbi:MAG TPA: DUF58 domain-containing protein [Chitinophagaceae bacterium]|nr:DUF58 domain-containing protein [Chitinophagaceae bacterium]
MVADEQLPALLRKVRQIEIKTKGLSNHIFSGEYHSAFKGRGMSFSEVREYSYGDDVRSIDWNVTARFRSPFIKVFEEERELTLMLIVDISASSLFGSKKLNKRELITEICAVLAFSAISNNDKVGVILFSDRIEKYIPPKKGKSHILFIIRELLSIQPHKKSSTNIEEALKFMNAVMFKRCISFLLSDFISPDFGQALKVTAKKHDLIGIQVYDKRDIEFPDIGLVQVQDAESGMMQWIDSSSAQFRQAYAQSFLKHETQTTNAFRKSGSSLLSIRTDDDYIKKLQVFFKGR